MADPEAMLVRPAQALGRIGLVGAGAVGSRIARQLAPTLASSEPLRVFDVRPGAVDSLGRGLPIESSTLAALESCDVVVVAHPAPQAPTAHALVRRGVHVVCTSDDVADTRELLALHDLAASKGALLVVGAAACPGLTGLLVCELARRMDSVDEVHVAVHGTGGPECAKQHHRALAGTSIGWHDGEFVKRPAGSGRELCWFPEPIGGRDCYRAELADPLLLRRVAPSAVRISARMSATRRDRLTARLPMLTPPHAEGGLGGLRVEVRGSVGRARVSEVAGVAERTAIAAAAVAATTATFISRACFGVDRGAVVLGQAGQPHAELLDDVRARGVRVYEYAGHDVL